MGRGCTMDEWVHFERLQDEGRVPNSSYWYVHCRHCVRGYEQKQLVNAPVKLTGRRSAMKAHLKVCPMYATQYKMEQRALAAAAAAVAATTVAHTRVQDTNGTMRDHDIHNSTVAIVAEAVTATGDDDITINHTVSMDPSLLPSTSQSLSPSVSSNHSSTTTPGGTQGASGTVTIKTQSGEKRKRRGEDVEASGPRGGRGKHCMMEEWEHFIRLQDEGYIGKSNFFYAVCRHCQAAYDQADDAKKPAIALEKMVGRREKMRKHLSVCPYFKGELPSLERRTPARMGPGGSGGGPHAFLPLPTADGIKMVPASALTSAAGLEAAGLSFGGAMGNANGSGLAEANPGELAMAPASVASVSARLALDEWQYFTRLQRKKDSAYYFARCNFCQQAFDNAPDALRSSMVPTVVMGRKSNMQTHLAKCPYVPKDAVLFGKSSPPLVLGGGHSASGSSGAMYTATASRGEYAAASKRFKMAGQLDTGSASLHLILVEFLIQQRLPFEWVDTASARKLLRLAAVGANVNTNSLPTSDELRGPVLDELVRNEYQRDVERLKQTVALPLSPLVVATDGATSTATDDAPSLATARLPVMLKLSLSQLATESELPAMDCELSANGVAVPLEYVVTDKEHTAAIVENDETEDEHENEDDDEDHRWMVAGAGATSVHVARQLTSQLQRLYDDQQLTAGVLVAPPSPAMSRVVGLLRGKFPGIACVWNLDDVVSFCVRKALENAHIAQVVHTTVELWQSVELQAVLSSGTSELASSSIMSDWRTFSAFAQELLSEPLCSAIEGKVSRDELLRVGNLFRALTVVHAASLPSQDSTRVTLADAFTHLATLHAAADGFSDVQRALEVAWHASEQPLFVLAHALHPHSRLRGVAVHTDLTKLSVLSDLAVAYFTQFFGGRRPLSLRGDVTSFLHMSQPVFADSFVSEFPLVDDYYRYLRDNFPELAALMELLQSFSVASSHHREAQTTAKDVDEKTGYTLEESKKLAVLQERWKLDTPLQRPEASQKSVTLAEDDDDVLMEDEERRGVSSSRTATGGDSVVATWLHSLEEALAKRLVDFSAWETMFQTLNRQDEETRATGDAVATVAGTEPTEPMETTELPLPALAADDVDAYAEATKLQPPRATKVRLAQLFAGSETTTV